MDAYEGSQEDISDFISSDNSLFIEFIFEKFTYHFGFFCQSRDGASHIPRR